MTRVPLFLIGLAFTSACNKNRTSDVREVDTPTDPRPATDTGVDAVDPGAGPSGFIGSPCTVDSDCPFADSTCLLGIEGYPAGMCSTGCDEFCPDDPDHPVTFCVDDLDLPVEAPSLGPGACHSRCDFGFFPDSGCRPGYGCRVVPRPGGDSELYACLPGEPDALPSCYAELAAEGVRFEPTLVADRSPSTHPNLVCHVEAPVLIRPPMHGVDIENGNGESVGFAGSCELGLSLSDTVLDVQARGAESIIHYGVYNCRVIGGTNTLSEHGNGAAIDIAGFRMTDGSVVTLFDDWEHDTPSPVSPDAAWLYDAAHRWFDAGYWNTILTPNYNAAHDDHFHVDLAPGSDFIGFTDGRYIGPAPYSD